MRYQKIVQQAKYLYQEYRNKNKRKSVTSDEREIFMGKVSELWREEILPYWQKYGQFRQKDLEKLWWYGLPPRKLQHRVVLFDGLLCVSFV